LNGILLGDINLRTLKKFMSLLLGHPTIFSFLQSPLLKNLLDDVSGGEKRN